MKRVLVKKRILGLLIFFALFTVFLALPLAVTAQDSCDQLVIDEANVIGNRAGEVEAAVDDLVKSGADVRVRTIQSLGSAGNLDRYESQLEQQCPSWTDASGNRKNNLVVILLSLQDRQTGLYFGNRWDDAIGNRWTQIQTDIMNPRFAQGDYAGGIIAGLNEIERLIEGQLTGTGAPSQAGGLSAAWVVLIIFLVIIFIAASLVGLFLFRQHRKSRERQLAARQKALLAKQGAASKVNQLVDALQMLEIKVNATAAKISPEDAEPVLEGFNKAKNLVDQGAQKYSELGHSAGNPENPKLRETQLEVITQEYQKVLDILNQGGEEVNRVETALATFQEAIDNFNNKATGIKTIIEAVPRKIESAQSSGFKTDYPTEILAKANLSMEQAGSLYQSRKYLQAMKTLDESADLAGQADRYIDELPQKKQETEAAIQSLAQRIEQVKESITKGRNIFDRISNSYAESSWESIEGNGTEAENRVDWTLEALDSARQAASLDQQDWPKALELTKQGNVWIDEAESFMHSITALEKSLETARHDAPKEIEAAQTDVIQAWKYINTYDADIRESLEDDLREAEGKLAAASEALRRNRADYLMIVSRAREANEAADKILIQARSEHEAAERMRSKAVSTLRDARSSVSIAREYIQDHSRDVGDEARNLLASAEAALGQAEVSTDPNAQISWGEKAEGSAKKAYSSARARVSTAWERRQPSLPPVIILPGGGGSRGGGSSWGSRRSSPWGSGGGGGGRSGGGGSTGWGGSRGGGGRGGSTRW